MLKLKHMKLKDRTVRAATISASAKILGNLTKAPAGGTAVQIYLCADKSGSERADLIRRFYQAALKDKSNDTKGVYPDILRNDGFIKRIAANGHYRARLNADAFD